LGGRVTGPGLAAEIVEVWMKTAFEGGRHATRLVKIEELSEKIKDSHRK
jgi:ribose 5-phosphate isomerase B